MIKELGVPGITFLIVTLIALLGLKWSPSYSVVAGIIGLIIAWIVVAIIKKKNG